MTKPRLATQAHGQRLVLELLTARSGAVVTIQEIAMQMYGSVSPETHVNARQVVATMRRRYPGLGVERVFGYRLRRPV